MNLGALLGSSMIQGLGFRLVNGVCVLCWGRPWALGYRIDVFVLRSKIGHGAQLENYLCDCECGRGIAMSFML